jgi:hypothetical protein
MTAPIEGGATQGLCHEHSKADSIGEAADANAAAVHGTVGSEVITALSAEICCRLP